MERIMITAISIYIYICYHIYIYICLYIYIYIYTYLYVVGGFGCRGQEIPGVGVRRI